VAACAALSFLSAAFLLRILLQPAFILVLLQSTHPTGEVERLLPTTKHYQSL